MSDNLTTTTTVATIPSGTVVATDDVASVHYQKVKLVDGTADVATAIAAGGGVESGALRVTLANDSTGVVSIDDNGGNLSVDFAGTAPPIGAGVEATALRVTLATDSTGVVSVDDNGGVLTVDGSGNFTVVQATAANLNAAVTDGGGSLTVDGTVTANAGTGTFTVGDGGSAISVDDNSGSLTVDGTVGVSGTVTVDSELPAAAGLGDAASATPTTTTLAAVPLLMNATTIDRQRAVVAALDSVGTGIAAAGIVGQLDDTSTASVTENQFAPVRISSRRFLLSENVPIASAVDSIGTSPFFNSALLGTVTNVKTSAGNVYAWSIGNPNSSVAYVQVFNALAVNVTLGTTTPSYSIPIPASSGSNFTIPVPVGHSTAISVAATTTATGAVAPSSGLVVNIFYK